MKKILTVSIAAYNMERYLRQTLDSFLTDKRTMERLQVIIVNDGSTDRTAAVAQQYADRYPDTFVLMNQENGGYGSTINSSIRHAAGKYFRTVDGDDWVDSRGLEKFIRLLESCDSDMVLTKYMEAEDGSGRKRIEDGGYVYDGIEKKFEELLLEKTVGMHHAAFKTELFRKHGIQITEHCFYTDMEYNLKPAAFVKTVTCMDIVLYMYRVGRKGQSVSLESWHKNIDQALQVSLGLADYWETIRKDKEAGSAQKRYIKNGALDSVKAKYRLLLTMPDCETAKQKCMQYDKDLKQISPLLYQAAVHVKERRYRYAVWLLRKTGFALYGFIAFLYKKTMMRAHERTCNGSRK